MGARLLVCLLCSVGASAAGLEASRVARQNAKARLSGDVDALVRALNSGLMLDAQPSMVPIAQLARQRLGMEAAELEQESLPEAMMLRAFTGGAPDSVLVMPPEMMGGPPEMMGGPLMPSGVMIVEQSVSAPDMDLVPRPSEPIVAAAHFKKESSVKDAVKHLTTEMRTIEESMGRKALEDIINEFFVESAVKRAEKNGTGHESAEKEAEEKPAPKEEKEPAAAEAGQQPTGSLKVRPVSSGDNSDGKAKPAMVERMAALSHPAGRDAKIHAPAAMKTEHDAAVEHSHEKHQAPAHSSAKAAAPAKKAAPVHAVNTEHHATGEHSSHEKHQAPAHTGSTKAAAPAKKAAPAHAATKAEHHAPAQHGHEEHPAPALGARKAAEVWPPKAVKAETAMVEHGQEKRQTAADGDAKAAALDKKAAGLDKGAAAALKAIVGKKAGHRAGEWPTGNKDATWQHESTLFQRKCHGNHCVVKMLRKRK